MSNMVSSTLTDLRGYAYIATQDQSSELALRSSLSKMPTGLMYYTSMAGVISGPKTRKRMEVLDQSRQP